ncbi:helix-turn-helix transcriptional regulator [Lentisphaera profundi]|uniref:Helix-turn-helix transcriptional regulator n=1 Tax=Lentisphaera profundi TaxID=1658616 RepID=A0ABY7W151_9BACT|nr:helix-turn-helix transcriptional regulator [Lentisphaera profundi]WDE98847.1 helix-turn-helix transcriptional regulator [Lentisphaera profundi]
MKNYDWSELVSDIISHLHITQSQLAEKCMVTQQTISNWKNGSRKPGVYAQEKVFKLSQQANLTLSNYVEINNWEELDPKDMIRSCLKGLTQEQKKISLHMLLTLSEDFRQQNLNSEA